VLTAEGVTFISTPNRDVFGQKNPFHIKEFTKKEFIEELQKHFSFVSIFEQKNGLASVISGSGQQKILVQDKNSEALYFIAICSQREIIEKVDSVASINISALKRWQNQQTIDSYQQQDHPRLYIEIAILSSSTEELF
jgi:predicted membrane-bound dolichyl-phosphate-mannose-protein mannosyltransferase